MKNKLKLARCLWLAGMMCSLVPVYCGNAPVGEGDKDKKPAQPPTATKPAKPSPPPVAAAAANIQIEINLSVVSFDKKDLEDVARKSPGASVQAADVLALWRAGKGRLVTTCTGRTDNGEQFTIKDITEWRYPSGCNLPTALMASNQPINMTYFMSSDFQTREVGVVFNMTPSLCGDKITLTLVPEISTLCNSNKVEIKSVTVAGTNEWYFGQPTFRSQTVTVKTTCTDGETLVYSSDILGQVNKEISYLLITPHLVRP